MAALPDRPLTQGERFAFARHDRFESVIPHDVREDPASGEEVMYAALFVSEEWVTAVNYREDEGWEVLYRGAVEENVVANGVLSTKDLDDDHPIREGMQAMTAVRDHGDGD